MHQSQVAALEQVVEHEDAGGDADPEDTSVRVDTGLYYHELGHCVDDTNPIYGGMREGLADFAAAFCYHELGQVAQARAAIGAARRAFLADYLERDLEYWRIPNYGPSAGFFLHFVRTYAKREDGRGAAMRPQIAIGKAFAAAGMPSRSRQKR